MAVISRHRARCALILYALILTCCLAVLVRGYVQPSYVKPLKVGDRFPQFVLADEMGNHYESAWLKHRPVMLVYCASRNGLSSEQASEIARFRQQLEAKMAINSVAVVTSHDQTICEQAREICGLVLVDEDRRLRPLAGSRDAEVSICLLDRYGYIRMRADLPASGVTSSSSKDRLITGSLAILDESITLY